MPDKHHLKRATRPGAVLFALLCLTGGSTSPALAVDQAQGLTIVKGGQPAATIVVAAAATDAEPKGAAAKVAVAVRS